MQTLLGLLLGPPIVAGFTWILQRTSAYMPLYLWAFFFALQIFFMTIYPVFIAPLFNKFSPLEKGTLRYAHPHYNYISVNKMLMQGCNSRLCATALDASLIDLGMHLLFLNDFRGLSLLEKQFDTAATTCFMQNSN